MPVSINNANDPGALYSHEVKDIISQKPNWIVRNGISLFLAILFLIIGLTFFIQYPDVVHAQARLASVNPPIELKTKTAGKLMRLQVKEKDSVNQGDIIAVMESVANTDELLKLYNSLHHVKSMMESSQTLQAINFYESQNNAAKWSAGLGEVQEGYHAFINAFQVFRQYLAQGFYPRKKAMLNADMIFLQRMQQNYRQQKSMLEEDIDLASKNFSANESLNGDKVIADVEYRNEKSKFIGKQMGLPQLNASIIGNESSVHEKRKEILQLENDIAQQKMIFNEALNSFLAKLEQWQATYLIRAPFAGRVSFIDFINANQFYPLNQTICLVNPGTSNFYAQLFIQQNNFGKIQTGQKVLLKLPAYPYTEFGSIKGKLDFISNISSDSGFAAKISLPEGLSTNQHKMIQYREGLIADAEIVTADRRLSDRFIASLRSLLERR